MKDIAQWYLEQGWIFLAGGTFVIGYVNGRNQRLGWLVVNMIIIAAISFAAVVVATWTP